MAKLIQFQTNQTCYWYGSDEDISNKDLREIKEKYKGNLEEWLDAQEEKGRDLRDYSEVLREKDLGTDVEFFIEDDEHNKIEF